MRDPCRASAARSAKSHVQNSSREKRESGDGPLCIPRKANGAESAARLEIIDVRRSKLELISRAASHNELSVMDSDAEFDVELITRVGAGVIVELRCRRGAHLVIAHRIAVGAHQTEDALARHAAEQRVALSGMEAICRHGRPS